LGLRRPILWTQNPFAARLVEQLHLPGLVYDVTDDWTAFGGASPRFTARAIAGDALLTRRADVVIACSALLYKQKRSQARRTVLVPNGVDVDHYATIGDPGGPVAPAVAAIPRPILGYTGSVHESRLDLDLIVALAEARPHLSLVFVGPLFLAAPSLARLAHFSNVHLLGPVPYSHIAAYMQGCDALMIPHRVSAFTESLNPIKLFEYLAAGLPVVATPVAGVRDYADVIRIAASPAAFIAAVDTAIAERAHFDRSAARRHAEPARWALRVDAVLAAIDAVMGSTGNVPLPGSGIARSVPPRLEDSA
jgi:glycosyltransferase involved in cell wall biosynthesis